jgi:hypothetical protein
VFFSVPPGECWDSFLKLCHYRFHPNRFQFILHASPFYSTQIVLGAVKASLNKLQIDKSLMLLARKAMGVAGNSQSVSSKETELSNWQTHVSVV